MFPMSQLASAAPAQQASDAGPAPVSHFRTDALGVSLWSQMLLDARRRTESDCTSCLVASRLWPCLACRYVNIWTLTPAEPCWAHGISTPCAHPDHCTPATCACHHSVKSKTPAATLQNLNRGISKHAQLKGDRMFAPVQPNESRLLAVSLVKLSMWLNSLLGLDRPVGAKETSGQGMVKVGPACPAMQDSDAACAHVSATYRGRSRLAEGGPGCARCPDAADGQRSSCREWLLHFIAWREAMRVLQCRYCLPAVK